MRCPARQPLSAPILYRPDPVVPLYDDGKNGQRPPGTDPAAELLLVGDALRTLVKLGLLIEGAA